MKKFAVIIFAVTAGLSVAGAASAALVTSFAREVQEVPLIITGFNGALAAGTNLAGYVLPAERGFRFTHFTTCLSVVSGGGAGNTVVRLTDGTNNCDFTIPCTTSQALGALRVAGTGSCIFPAGAAITWSTTTAGCTTTQPSARNPEFIGQWN